MKPFDRSVEDQKIIIYEFRLKIKYKNKMCFCFVQPFFSIKAQPLKIWPLVLIKGIIV